MTVIHEAIAIQGVEHHFVTFTLKTAVLWIDICSSHAYKEGGKQQLSRERKIAV